MHRYFFTRILYVKISTLKREIYLKRLQNHYYHQRILVLLAPLLLLAIVTWGLDARNTPGMDGELRMDLLSFMRVCIPALLSVLITFLIPVANRTSQVFFTLLSYVILVVMLGVYRDGYILYPTIAALAATTSVFAQLKKPQELIRHPLLRTFFKPVFSVALPLITASMIVVLMEQTTVFVTRTFTGDFAKSELAVIYVPIYLIMQSFGFHHALADIAIRQYSPESMTAFFNTILVTMLFVLPTTIFARSLFSHGTLRITLTFLGVCTILTSSIGSCVSFVLVFLVIFFPGTFITISLCSVCLFFISTNLQIPLLVKGTELYRPDISLSFFDILSKVPQSRVLIMAAMILPMVIILLSSLLRIDKINLERKKQARSLFSSPHELWESPDLQVIALLRALGGISNLKQVDRRGSRLRIAVNDIEQVALSGLAAVCVKRPSVDRARKIYTCDFGPNAKIIDRRIARLSDDFLGQRGSDIAIAKPYIIPPHFFVHQS